MQDRDRGKERSTKSPSQTRISRPVGCAGSARISLQQICGARLTGSDSSRRSFTSELIKLRTQTLKGTPMSRPRDRAGISPTTQREIVWWVAKGHSMEEAAKRAGLPSSGRLYDFKKTREFAADLRDALRDRLDTELAPQADKYPGRTDDRRKDPCERPAPMFAATVLDRAGLPGRGRRCGRDPI